MSFEASTESKNRIFSFRPIRLQCRLYFVFLVIYSCVEPIILAGFPPTTEYGGRLGHDCSSCDNTALSDGYSGHDLAITPYITPILNLNSSKNIEVRNKQANSIPPPHGYESEHL